jgi:hypothetical protein
MMQSRSVDSVDEARTWDSRSKNVGGQEYAVEWACLKEAPCTASMDWD